MCVCVLMLHSCLSSACTESLVISFVSFSIWLKRHHLLCLCLQCCLAMGSLSLDFLSDFSCICSLFICNIPWWNAAILLKMLMLGFWKSSRSVHEQHFGDNVRTGCWGKYGSFVRGHSRLDCEQRAVLFESPSCSRDTHSAHLSILPPMQPSIWLASAFLCQDVRDPSCGHSAYFPTLLWASHLRFLWLCVWL